MEKDFWLNKWKKREIGFHQSEYNEYLVEFWEEIKEDNESVFVPLCGKTRDMIFLRDAGHDILGVELSETAIIEFFAENKMNPEKLSLGQMTSYYCDGIKIIHGNLFDIPANALNECKYIYDRASIVALPRMMREQYAEFLLRNSEIRQGLLVAMSFDDEELGPPFSIPKADLYDLFHGQAELTELKTIVEEGNTVSVHAGKIERRFEEVYKIKFKR